MIEKMKFISISGPKDDLDRMVNQNLSHYEIQFENAMTELRSVAKLVPYSGENPYKEPFASAKKLLALYPDSRDFHITGSLKISEAMDIITEAKKEAENFSSEAESLEKRRKELQELLDQVH